MDGAFLKRRLMKRPFSLSVCTSLQHLEKLDLCSIQVIIPWIPHESKLS